MKNIFVILCDININVLVHSKEQNMLASQNMEFLIDIPTRVTNNSQTAIAQDQVSR